MHGGLGHMWGIVRNLLLAHPACTCHFIILVGVCMGQTGCSWKRYITAEGGWERSFLWGHWINHMLCTCLLTVTHHIRWGVKFSTSGIMMTLKNSNFEASQILDFWTRDAQSVFSGKNKHCQGEQICSKSSPCLDG